VLGSFVLTKGVSRRLYVQSDCSACPFIFLVAHSFMICSLVIYCAPIKLSSTFFQSLSLKTQCQRNATSQARAVCHHRSSSSKSLPLDHSSSYAAPSSAKPFAKFSLSSSGMLRATRDRRSFILYTIEPSEARDVWTEMLFSSSRS